MTTAISVSSRRDAWKMIQLLTGHIGWERNSELSYNAGYEILTSPLCLGWISDLNTSLELNCYNDAADTVRIFVDHE